MVGKHISYKAVVYLIVGIYVTLLNYKAGVMWFTAMPLMYLIQNSLYKKRMCIFWMYSIFLFITQGINPCLFFLRSDEYSKYGFLAVGNFNWELSSFFLRMFWLWPF